MNRRSAPDAALAGVAIDSDDLSLAARAAWLHYVGGMRQAAVAKALGLPAVKTHRLIARAVAEGMVKISIDGPIVECLELGRALAARYGLEVCEIAPDLGEPGLPLRALSQIGASYLRRQIESRAHPVIGIGHGRTLAGAVRVLPRFDPRGQVFVSLLGGLTRNYAANPHDVMHLLAEKTGATAHVIPLPFAANSADDMRVMLSQRGVTEVFEMAQAAPLKIVGVGQIDAQAQLVTSGMIEPREIHDISAAGAVGEMLGHFFTADGATLETPLSARIISAGFDIDTPRSVVALSGGAEKVAPLRAVLRSGRLMGLLTDERTARALLD